MTTKKQEREAMEQIKNIIEALGPDSYIAVALDGCLELAAENIDNDFACSMKQRAEAAERQLEAMKTAHNSAMEALSARNRKIEELTASLEEAKAKQISAALAKAIWDNMAEQIETGRQNMARAAEQMSNYAETPADIAFQAAVKSYRKDKQTVDRAAWIKDRIANFRPEGC